MFQITKIFQGTALFVAASTILSNAAMSQATRDVISNQNGRVICSTNDLSSNWANTPRFLAQNFSVKGNLGGTIGNRWDSSDRLRFYVPRQMIVSMQTSPNVITELVRFDNGVPTVIASTEYGNFITSQLPPGQYGLSFSVEGDLASYSASASFRLP